MAGFCGAQFRQSFGHVVWSNQCSAKSSRLSEGYELESCLENIPGNYD